MNKKYLFLNDPKGLEKLKEKEKLKKKREEEEKLRIKREREERKEKQKKISDRKNYGKQVISRSFRSSRLSRARKLGFFDDEKGLYGAPGSLGIIE